MAERTDGVTGQVFTLALTNVPELTADVRAAVAAAGCGDAAPGIRSGRVCLTFNRPGPSPTAAVMAAILALRKVGLATRMVTDGRGKKK